MRTYGSVDLFVYKEYFKAGGNWCIIFNMACMYLLAQLFASGSDYFVAQWYELRSLYMYFFK